MNAVDSNRGEPTAGRSRATTGFSLIEVVVAVGIFAISIVAVIGLLSPISRSVSEVRDTDDATRVVNAIQEQLQALTIPVVAPTLVNASDIGSVDVAAMTDGRIFYASRDGLRFGTYNRPNVWKSDQANNDDSLKFFEVVLVRNESLSPSANDSTAGYLAFTMRLRWPAFVPDPDLPNKGRRYTDAAQKSVLLVPAATHR